MQEKPTIITEETRFELGRGRLLSLGWTRPDIFDIAVKVEKNHRHLFEGFLHRLPTSYWMSTLEQAVTYRHVIYSEGWCGWADRLKTLLIFNSTIFLQQTPCHEYYQDLLKPFVHYVPVDGIFRNLPERVEWARSNPASSAKIADNASRMADKYLSSYSIKCYINLVLERYISLCKYKPRRRPMSEPWRPVLLEKTEL